ncbi:MAG: GH25 family lysozyme [Bacteroidia bacterium]
MIKYLRLFALIAVANFSSNAQQCLSTGFCTNITNQHQYPTTTFSTTSSTWQLVNAYMNADNYTLFSVVLGNTYEWSYCETHQGVSTAWDAQLTLSNNSSGANICFSDNSCGASGNAPYISWAATFTGVVKVLTSQYNCASNSGAPYNTLMWRMANGTPSTLIEGVDVSSYEGSINWTSVKAAGYKFAFAKATEGLSVTDAYFVTNQVNGVAAGMPMGAYHFAHPVDNTAIAEANHFLSVAGAYIKACELPPVLDLEDPPSGPSLSTFYTSPQLTAWVQTWMSTVQSATGITPIIYIGPSNASFVGSSLNTYGLWIDDYNSNANNPPANTGVWTNWEFKQFSWTGTIPGISGSGGVDKDVFHGDSIAFKTMLNCATTSIGVQNNFTKVVVYPNPNNGLFTIQSSVEGNYSITNELGQTIENVNLNPSNNYSVEISNLAEGVYFVIGTEQNNVVRKKIVVVR